MQSANNTTIDQGRIDWKHITHAVLNLLKKAVLLYHHAQGHGFFKNLKKHLSISEFSNIVHTQMQDVTRSRYLRQDTDTQFSIYF